MAQAKESSAPRAKDAVALLKADHVEVSKLFKQFDKLKEEGGAREKTALVATICEALTVHTQIEEEIFYPAVREAINDDDMMDEADVEHMGAKDLIGQLEDASPGDDHYDAKVTVLAEQIRHHVKEEEEPGGMFSKAKKSKVDLKALGEQMAKRKAELMGSGVKAKPMGAEAAAKR